jgi:hypothetical protein
MDMRRLVNMRGRILLCGSATKEGLLIRQLMGEIFNEQIMKNHHLGGQPKRDRILP